MNVGLLRMFNLLLLHWGSVIPSRKSLTFLFSGMGLPRHSNLDVLADVSQHNG
jgi:hypothetical protein